METLDTLYRWHAKRAGGRITIYHSTGKITGVDTIKVDGEGRIVAVDKKGNKYTLSVT